MIRTKSMLLTVLVMLILNSCYKKDSIVNNEKNSKQKFETASFYEKKEILKNEKLVKKIDNLTQKILKSIDSGLEIDIKIHTEVSNLLDRLNNIYGENNINVFINSFDENNFKKTNQNQLKINNNSCVCETWADHLRFAILSKPCLVLKPFSTQKYNECLERKRCIACKSLYRAAS